MRDKFRLTPWGRSIVAGWVLLLSVAAFFNYGPDIETRLNPVISKAEILSIAPSGHGSLVTVRFRKLRACEYLGISWLEVRDDGILRRAALRLRAADDENGRTRPTGTQVAGPWYVGIEPDRIRDHSFVQLFYRCHSLWQTVADFYP